MKATVEAGKTAGVMYKPCAHCPFRTDRPAFLSKAKARQIMRAIDHQQDFHCHKTVDYSDSDETGEGRSTADSKICAGFAVICENEERPTLMMRIMERLGMYDMSKLDKDAPVHQTREDFIEAQKR